VECYTNPHHGAPIAVGSCPALSKELRGFSIARLSLLHGFSYRPKYTGVYKKGKAGAFYHV
jgi:hypothetical protein